jgi:hypothetical protein
MNTVADENAKISGDCVTVAHLDHRRVGRERSACQLKTPFTNEPKNFGGFLPRRLTNAAAVCAMLIWGCLYLAPSASARADINFGNYNLNIPDRYDFHTWIWVITPCSGTCVRVSAIAQPVARAFKYSGDAALANGHYTLAVDVPDGLRCGNVYYGPTYATHDVYDWDATTLAGTLNSTFDAGCDGNSGTLTFVFTITRL